MLWDHTGVPARGAGAGKERGEQRSQLNISPAPTRVRQNPTELLGRMLSGVHVLGTCQGREQAGI